MGTPGRRRALVPALACVIAAVLAGCGGRGTGTHTQAQATSATSTTAAAAPQTLNYGPFGGYQEFGPVVHSISAIIRVPRSSTGQRLSAAGTWVGAEALGAAGLAEPFIQAGVNEISPGQGQPVIYYAFWTDTARGFHPVSLFIVHPGDDVYAQLVLSGGHWTIVVQDRTLGRERRIVTGQEADATFRSGLWLQEDVTQDIRTLKVAPYPNVENPRFSALMLNGAAPRAADLNTSWLSVASTVRKPSALANDSFTVEPSRRALAPTLAREILTAERPGAKAAIVLAKLMTGPVPSAATRRRIGNQAADGLLAEERLIASEPALAHVEAMIPQAGSVDARFIALVRSAGQVSAAAFGRWRAEVNADSVTDLLIRARVARMLGLPEIPVTAQDQ